LDILQQKRERVKRETRNPMRKIAIVAATCCVCFLLRTCLLGLMLREFEDQPWEILVPYFSVAEIIPIILLLYVFNSSATWTSPEALRELTKYEDREKTEIEIHANPIDHHEDEIMDDTETNGYQQPLIH